MGGASSFYAMLAICGFLSAAWSATKISKLIGISSIVLEITTGVVLGPRALGLINREYAQCEHQRHADCEPPADLYDRIAHGLPLGETMGRIANMEYCDLHGYLEKEGRLGLLGEGHGSGHESGHGHGSGPSDHRDPCGDGAHLNGLYVWNVSLGNGSVARYHCRNGTMIQQEYLHPASGSLSGSEGSVEGTEAPSPSITTAAPANSTAGELAATTASTTASSAVTSPVAMVSAEEACMKALGCSSSACLSNKTEEEMLLCANFSTQATTTQMIPSPIANGTQIEATTTEMRSVAVGNGTELEATTATTTEVVPSAVPSSTPVEANETDAEESGADAADAGEAAANGERRLSGGGGGIVYDTYAQCLERSCEADVSHHCGLTPDVFTLIGHAGVALMIFESGMHFDFEKAREVGLPACIVAVIGTILPLITGSLMVMGFGKPLVPDGVSAGTALAPTSVGISLRLLGEAGVLQENFGQAIITAAFVDDILSLVLFNVLFSLGGDFDVITTVVYPVVGIIFMIGCMIAAVKFWPTVIDSTLMPMIPDERDDLATGLKRIRLTKDEVLFLIMMAILVVYALITHLLGTHLWGCFMAGMSFACLKPVGHAHHVWVKQTKRMTTWMVRIFFACTVAFSIPVADLMSVNAFWKGTLMGLGPCIATKVSCALFMGPPRFVIGWAMVGRAEFAYLIAQMAAAANMIDEETFSICIWALLYATIFAPFVFRFLLNRYIRQYGLGDSKVPLADAEDPIEEHNATHSEEKRNSRRDYSSPGDRLRDLDEIQISADALEDNRAPGVQASRVPGEDGASHVYALPAKSATRPRGGQKVRQGQQTGNGIFPGAAAKSSGFLCCLFFRRIVEQ